MTFGRPDLLVLLPIAAATVAIVILVQWLRSRRLVAAYGGRESARRLLGRDLARVPLPRLVAGTLAVAALVFAAADPRPEEAPEPPPPTPIDLIVLVDVSHSMSATDVGARRIDRARALLDHIVAERAADRIGLAIFADWPYTLVPLTDDGDVVTFFGPWLTPELVGTRDQGTSVPAALGTARAMWEAREREDARRIVLMISDAEIHEGRAEVLDSAAAVSDAGFEIWTAGVGTPGGAPLHVPGSEEAPLLYDGQPVIAGYDEGLLRDIAEVGRGTYHDVSGEDGTRALVDALVRDRPVGDTRQEVAWRPALFLLLAALLLLVLEAGIDFGRLAAGTPRTKRAGDRHAAEHDPGRARARAEGARSSPSVGGSTRRVA